MTKSDDHPLPPNDSLQINNSGLGLNGENPIANWIIDLRRDPHGQMDRRGKPTIKTIGNTPRGRTPLQTMEDKDLEDAISELGRDEADKIIDNRLKPHNDARKDGEPHQDTHLPRLQLHTGAENQAPRGLHSDLPLRFRVPVESGFVLD
ncbi:unnamed protein product [Lepeophtheirus salmonis]|uniref:(salmon louse) hypothetical protein n=1 Tax=Lepeophtheirus salmonis TaxID=72036 RepID=A0A7R8D4R1_LEPSM|nr:unnamed protein product [Lepeophtheirus salmonis]CAF3028405.1 unnamed protein product [Lepeophtheirus salmonis]